METDGDSWWRPRRQLVEIDGNSWWRPRETANRDRWRQLVETDGDS